MRFALVNNNRIEAQPQLHGLCPCCSKPVISKCGIRKIWHWAHKSKTECDHWWEPETEWHRTWKNNYPADWQETILLNERNGEKHIADVRAVHDLIIEFQHSHISHQERISREQYYRNMVWVVDGARLKRDYPRFLKEWKRDGISEVYKTDKSGIFKVGFPEFCFPEAWLKSSVPVIFDFLGDGTMDDPESMRNLLYCLFPQVGKNARVAEISRKAFINATKNGEWTLRVQDFINEFRNQDIAEQREERYTSSFSANKVIYTWGGIPLFGGYKKYQKRFSTSHKPSRKKRR
jgi:competence protein CoiA